MKRLIPLILILLCCCKDKYPSIPKGIIPEDKMKLILIDMHIADAVAQNKSVGGVNEKKETAESYAAIFKNYGITREEFIKSWRFYEDNPVLLNKLYDEMLGDMSKLESDMTKSK